MLKSLDLASDFAVLYVYDMEGNFLISKIMGLDEIHFNNGLDFIDINIGQHLRDLGFREGDYQVTYKFLRRLAGRERPQFVDEAGEIWDREVDREVVNGEVKFLNLPVMKQITLQEKKYLSEI